MRLLPLLLIVGLVSCGSDPSGPERPAAPVAPLKPVSYHRSGGLMGTSDHIRISSTGTVQVTGRVFGESNTLLTEFQMMQLARLFEGWEKLDAEYPAERGAADDFVTEIRYGDKSVAASDAARDVPEQFTRVKQRLEALVRNLPAK
jgi:hypothetical protein